MLQWLANIFAPRKQLTLLEKFKATPQANSELVATIERMVFLVMGVYPEADVNNVTFAAYALQLANLDPKTMEDMQAPQLVMDSVKVLRAYFVMDGEDDFEKFMYNISHFDEPFIQLAAFDVCVWINEVCKAELLKDIKDVKADKGNQKLNFN